MWIFSPAMYCKFLLFSSLCSPVVWTLHASETCRALLKEYFWLGGPGRWVSFTREDAETRATAYTKRWMPALKSVVPAVSLGYPSVFKVKSSLSKRKFLKKCLAILLLFSVLVCGRTGAASCGKHQMLNEQEWVRHLVCRWSLFLSC